MIFGLINIGVAAFEDCRGLTNFTIPGSVLTIGKAAFVRCTSLASINIPASVTSLENSCSKAAPV